MEIYKSDAGNKTSITATYEPEGIKFLKHVVCDDLSFELGSHFLVKGPVDVEHYKGWNDLNEIAADLEGRGNTVVWLVSWVTSPLSTQSC